MSGAIGGAGARQAIPSMDEETVTLRSVEPAQASPEAATSRAPTSLAAASTGRFSALAQLQGAEPPATPRDPKVDGLLRAFASQSAPELTKTLAAAKEESPVAYRTALREFFRENLDGKSKLTLHNMAMDANNDGWLTFGESYKTMHAMGFHPVRAFLLSALTAVALAPQTNDGFSFKVNVARSDDAQRAMFRNGFDNAEALEERLDEVMRHDQDKDGFVSLADMERMVDERVKTMSSKLGAAALAYLNKGEWQALFKLMDGKMTRDELRDFYQGSLFFGFLEPDNLAKKIVHYRG